MKAKCKDNSHTWRSVLTIGKIYEVHKLYDDHYAGYPMIEITCDDDKIRNYRANRFDLIDQCLNKGEEK